MDCKLNELTVSWSYKKSAIILRFINQSVILLNIGDDYCVLCLCLRSQLKYWIQIYCVHFKTYVGKQGSTEKIKMNAKRQNL